MNYLGHAHLAGLERPEPLFILGSMLPDLANLAGGSPNERALLSNQDALGPGSLREGVRFHHNSDRVFHARPEFQGGTIALGSALRAGGVERGPARAMAHVGLEFLLDAAWAPETPDYLSALAEGARLTTWGEFPQELADRIVGLCTFLLERGLGAFEATQERLELRVARTLEGRKRLEPTPRELTLGVELLVAEAQDWARLAPGLAKAVLAELRVANWQETQNPAL